MFDYIEKPIVEQGEYQAIMKPLTFLDPKKQEQQK